MEIESAIPIVVRIFFEYSGNDVLTHALAFKQGIQSLSLSVPEEGSPSEKKGLSIDELVKQLFNKFLLICPAPYFRER